jgi:hypothetical protein
MSAFLATCDEHFVQQLHTIAETLLFPKPVSRVLERQQVVLRIRREAAAGGSATATLVRAEAVLAPLLDEAEGFAKQHLPFGSWSPGLVVCDSLAFWRGFFGDPEALHSRDPGYPELDHIAHGAGRLLGSRGLLPDLHDGRRGEMLPLRTLFCGATMQRLQNGWFSTSACLLPQLTVRLRTIRTIISLWTGFSIPSAMWLQRRAAAEPMPDSTPPAQQMCAQCCAIRTMAS